MSNHERHAGLSALLKAYAHVVDHYYKAGKEMNKSR